MNKCLRVIGVIAVVCCLAACGKPNEERIIGTWQEVFEGEKSNRFYEFTEDLIMVREGSLDILEMVEYRLTDESKDQFIVEHPQSHERTFVFGFEGSFTNDDTIYLGNAEEQSEEMALIRVENIEEALEEE